MHRIDELIAYIHAINVAMQEWRLYC